MLAIHRWQKKNSSKQCTESWNIILCSILCFQCSCFLFAYIKWTLFRFIRIIPHIVLSSCILIFTMGKILILFIGFSVCRISVLWAFFVISTMSASIRRWFVIIWRGLAMLFGRIGIGITAIISFIRMIRRIGWWSMLLFISCTTFLIILLLAIRIFFFIRIIRL